VLETSSVGIGTKPRAYWLGGLGKRYEVPGVVWGGAPAARHFLIVSMLNLVNLKVYIYTNLCIEMLVFVGLGRTAPAA